MSLARSGTLRLGLTALAVTLVAASCSGGSTGAQPTSVLAAAASKTYDAKTAKVAMDIDASGGQTIHVHGSGEMDFPDQSGELDLEIPDPSGGTTSVQTIYAGTTVYLKSKFFQQFLSSSKPWIKIDMAELAKKGNISQEQISQFDQSDPSAFVTYLRGAIKTDKVGTENVGGVSATHYKARIDVEKAAKNAPDSVAKQLESASSQLQQQTGSSTIPVDVWVDSQGRMVKEVLSLGTSGSAGGGVSTKISLELTDFGTDVSVQPPPDSQTTNITQLLPQGSSSPTG